MDLLHTKLASILTVTVLMLGLASSASIPCHNPNVTQLHAQWTDYIMRESMDAPESFFAVQMYRNMIASELAVESESEEIHLYGNQDNSQCDISHIEHQDALQDRSYCPWYNIINHSTDRYPEDLAEARCRCVYGAGMGAQSPCEPVHYSIRVLRRTDQCVNGLYVYTPGWQSISVGCTMTKLL